MQNICANIMLVLSLLLHCKAAVHAKSILTDTDSVVWKERTFWKDGEHYSEKYSVKSDSVMHGPYFLFDEKDQIVTIANYLNGKLHGEFWGLLLTRVGMYYQSGRYRHGKKEGLWKEKYLPPEKFNFSGLLGLINEEVKLYSNGQINELWKVKNGELLEANGGNLATITNEPIPLLMKESN